MEKEVIEQLVDNIKSKKISSKTDKKITPLNEKIYCKAAVKLNTYTEARNNIENNIDVYITVDTNNGKVKKTAYSRCSKSTNNGEDFCHIHKTVRKNPIKIFDTDIVPQTGNDKTRWLATLKYDFFEKIRKKKNKVSNSITFESNDVILSILKSENNELINELYNYAHKLSKNSKKEVLSNPILHDQDEKNKSKITVCNNDLLKSEDEYEDEDEEEFEADAEISTLNGTIYYLIKDNVYKQDENSNDGECIEIGILIEIDEKYHTVYHNNNYYAIMKKINEPKKGSVYLCIETNKIFDLNLVHIGIANCIDKNNYDFNYLDEI
jgi:hypothetical protein